MARLSIRTRRILLAQLAGSALFVGLPALLTPHGFFTSWPYFSHWVRDLGPYNEHLTTDVGEFYLAFGLAFAWAAVRPHPALVVPLGLAWSLSQAIHAAFHASHLAGMGVLDSVLELGALASVTVMGLLAAGAGWRATPPRGSA